MKKIDEYLNYEMSMADIKRVIKLCQNAENKYDLFNILATDNSIPKNSALQWYAGFIEEVNKKEKKRADMVRAYNGSHQAHKMHQSGRIYPQQSLSNATKAALRGLETRLELLESQVFPGNSESCE